MSVRSFKDSQGRKRYSVEFETRGSRIFRRLPPSATKEQATQLETRLRHELIDQTLIGKRPNVSIPFAIDAWLAESVAGRKSEHQTRSHALCVQVAVGSRAISEIAEVWQEIQRTGGANPSGVERGSPRAAGTINRRLCILKAVAKFAWRKGWTEDNLSGKIQLLPEPKYHRREATLGDARKLIEHAPTPRAKALIALSAFTGLRLGEVLRLKPADVRGGVIVARDTKNGTDRIVPILPELEPHLSQLPFTAGWRNVYRGFEAARKRAKLDIRYHDLRHMVASALANSEGDPRLSMKLMGHKSVVTHQRYVHPDMEVMRGMLGKALKPITPPIRKRPKAKKAA